MNKEVHKSCLILDIGLPAGVNIYEVCRDGIELATKLGITIKVEFNEKIIYILPHNNIDSLVEAYHTAIEVNSNFVCSFDKKDIL